MSDDNGKPPARPTTWPDVVGILGVIILLMTFVCVMTWLVTR